MGYFDDNILDSKVSKDRNVNANDYIYIEKDKNIKTITKQILLYDESSELINLCDNYVNGDGTIIDDVPPTCNLSVSVSGITFKDVSSDTVSSWLSTSSTATTGSSSLELSVGKKYGFVKDESGNVGSCSVVVENTQPSYSCSNYGSAPNNCYYTISATVGKGTCTCYYNNNNYISFQYDSSSCYTYCNNTYGTDAYYFGGVTYSCSYGTLSGQYCMVSESANVSYSCSDSYFNKVNNDYCWKTISE